MGALTLEQLDVDIAATRQAITDILTGLQQVSRPGLSYSRADLGQVREHLKYLLAQRNKMSGGTGLLFVRDSGGSTPSGFDE
jgi:hypothetical protein